MSAVARGSGPLFCATPPTSSSANVQFGAGEGNRTLVISLEGFCSTIELHPQSQFYLAFSLDPLGLYSPFHRQCGPSFATDRARASDIISAVERRANGRERLAVDVAPLN